LTEELSSALHEVSFGIADLANRIYLAAQVRAIENGSECITEGLLRSAYLDDFRLVSHIIETLKSGNEVLAAKIKDIHPPPIVHVQAIHNTPLNSCNSNAHISKQKSSEIEGGTKLQTETESPAGNQPSSNVLKNSSPANPTTTTRLKRKSKTKDSPATNSFEETDLRRVIARGLASAPTVNAYTALLNAGYIKNSLEFFAKEV
jgi:hypothetical protein